MNTPDYMKEFIVPDCAGYVMPKSKKKKKHTKTVKVRKKNPSFGSIIKSFENKCFYCGEVKGYLTKDHFFPKSKGGVKDLSNVVPACPPCNLAKGDRLPTAAERDKFNARNNK